MTLNYMSYAMNEGFFHNDDTDNNEIMPDETRKRYVATLVSDAPDNYVESIMDTSPQATLLDELGISGDYREEILKNYTIPKEETVKISKVNELIESFREDIGAGLMATEVFSATDGQSIAGFNSQAKASALFNQLTDYLTKSLSGAGFPPLGKFYMIDLEGGVMVFIIPLGQWRQGLLVDSKKVQLGLLLNVILPDHIKNLNDALNG